MPTRTNKVSPERVPRRVKRNRNLARRSNVLLRCTDAEKAELQRAAKSQALPLAVWIRECLLASARMIAARAA